MQRQLINEDAETIVKEKLDWKKLSGKSVLISGATGYVPQYFVHSLVKRNDLYGENIKIIAMCRNKARADIRFKNYYQRGDFELLLQDVCTPIKYMDNVDYIIHAASPAGVKTRYDDPVYTFDTNVNGCKNLLDLAREKKSIFLLVSSIDIYGKMESSDRLVENKYGELDPMNIRNVYSCSKKAAEALCTCYSEIGVQAKVVRPSQILAGGIALDDGRLHIDFISQILEKNKIILKGDGSPRRTFMYITDAITGMLYVLLEGKSAEAYNLCSENCEASVLTLAQTFISQVPSRKVEIAYNMETRKTDPAVTQVVSVVCGSSEKIRKLGWEPKINLEKACSRMMKYYGL